jgi:hypothetical protein
VPSTDSKLDPFKAYLEERMRCRSMERVRAVAGAARIQHSETPANNRIGQPCDPWRYDLKPSLVKPEILALGVWHPIGLTGTSAVPGLHWFGPGCRGNQRAEFRQGMPHF